MKKLTRLTNLLKFEYLALAIVLAIGFLLRLYKIDIPLADHHSWRQADTAAVARNFARNGINLFYPQLDNMAPTHAPGAENPNRLYLVEFPAYNAIIAVVYKIWGVKEMLARLVTIFFSLVSTVMLFLVARRYFGRFAGLLACFLFAVLPYNIYFSRVILPEPMMVASLLAAIYLFDLWLEKRSFGYYIFSLFFITLAFLVKPYSIFLVLVFVYLVFRDKGIKGLISWPVVLFGVLSVVPLLAWRFYINTMPEGVPASGWLLNSENIRFSGAFVRWMIFERMDKLILTVGGVVLFVLGLVLRAGKKEKWLFHVWLAGIIFYFFIFAKGNVTHDYYQIIFVPIGCIFMAKGGQFLLSGARGFLSRPLSYLVFTGCVLSILAFGIYEVRGFYNLQMGVDLAGRAVSKLTPFDSLVIAADTADVTLLYNCDRAGWAIGYGAAYPTNPETVELLRGKGAEFYVTTKVNELANDKKLSEYFAKNYKEFVKTNEYIIFDLR